MLSFTIRHMYTLKYALRKSCAYATCALHNLTYLSRAHEHIKLLYN